MLLVRVVSLFRFDKKKKSYFFCVVQYGGTHCSVVISGRSLVQNLKCLSPPSWNWLPVYAGSTAMDRCPFQGWGWGGWVSYSQQLSTTETGDQIHVCVPDSCAFMARRRLNFNFFNVWYMVGIWSLLMHAFKSHHYVLFSYSYVTTRLHICHIN